MVDTFRHAPIASATACAASVAGDPGPDGSFNNGFAHPAHSSSAAMNRPRKHENTKPHSYRIAFVLS
jgi:hypothetical protein